MEFDRLNLLTSSWLGLRQNDGALYNGRFSDITLDYQKNPIKGFEVPRPDFNTALVQLAIGILQACFMPKDEKEWLKYFIVPPSPELLQESFQKYEHCFYFDGDYPRFMQDEEAQTSSSSPITSLLIESPGVQTLEHNKDFFVKRSNSHAYVSREMSVLSLLTLQINAPSGGQGHRTSLRGGGPLSTILYGETLWQTIWLNIFPSNKFEACYPNHEGHNEIGDIFPWMRKTKNGKESKSITSNDAHPLTMYFATPRRIHMETTYHKGLCHILNQDNCVVMSTYKTLNYGNDYKNGWSHPLSPYNGNLETGRSAEHATEGCLQYNTWIGFYFNKKIEKKGKNSIEKMPAAVIEHYRRIRYDYMKRNIHNLEDKIKIWTFGYDMDKAKALCWYEGFSPLYNVTSNLIDQFDREIFLLITSANEFKGYITNTFIEILLEEKKDNKSKKKNDIKAQLRKSVTVKSIEASFWSDSEVIFHKQVHEISRVLNEKSNTVNKEKLLRIREGWLKELKRISKNIILSILNSIALSGSDVRKLCIAENNFLQKINSKEIRKILDLPENKD